MKNCVFISPNFPTNYWKFCRELRNPRPVVAHVPAPQVHPDVDPLLLEDLFQAAGSLRLLPGPLARADHALLPVVQVDIGVAAGQTEE